MKGGSMGDKRTNAGIGVIAGWRMNAGGGVIAGWRTNTGVLSPL